jgi:hypothetical protein
MRKVILILLLIKCCTVGHTQIITGTILDQYSNSPIDYALVYFNGTFVGTYSDQNGYFKLDISKNRLMPLTISALGYYSVTVSVLSADTVLLVYLKPKTFELKEIIVTASPKDIEKAKKARKANLQIFKKEFLGRTANSMKCEITNENDILLSYNQDNQILRAFCSNPVSVNNKALGYRITYYLDNFEYCRKNNSLIMSGNIVFNEDISIKDRQRSVFERRRKTAYLGSKMQFFRELWAKNLDSAGFKVKNRLNGKLSSGELVVRNDSISKYLVFRENPLIVRYYSKGGGSLFTGIKKYVYFDKNGYFDGNGVSLDGEMAEQRIADWLPYEYSVKRNNR